MDLAANALTTYDTVKDALGSDIPDSRRPAVERVINAVSAAMSTAAGGRVFQFTTGIVERVAGYGDYTLLIRQAPLKVITSVVLLGIDGLQTTLFDPASMEIDGDGESGRIFRTGGWPWTARAAENIRRSPSPGSERKSLQVTYDGGFVTPEQALTPSVLVRDLPFDLEEAAIMSIVSVFRRMTSDRNVTSESTGTLANSAFRFIVESGILLPESKSVAENFSRAWLP